MLNLIVVYYPARWPLQIPNGEVVSAKAYLTSPKYSMMKNAKVFNLSRSYRYQSMGYYVSLLAAARGHHPMPTVMTIQDMKSPSIIRFVSDELDELIQKSLSPLPTDRLTTYTYFGRNSVKTYHRLSRHLFNLFPSPLLKADFLRGDKWQLNNITPVSASEIPEDHLPFVHKVIAEHFSGKRITVPKRSQSRYDLAILHNPAEMNPPSDKKALRKFVKAAESKGIDAELITKEDTASLLEYDALFIRETTAVNHHTYRLARKAAAEGLIVLDDPLSILRCTNKVYLTELLHRHTIPIPKTVILHKENLKSMVHILGFPCILKQPDSSFSQGVIKVDDKNTMITKAEELLDKSDLILAQEYIPTAFDWRVGVLDKQPLYVCKYYMAYKHWQIIRRSKKGKTYEGKAEALPVGGVQKEVIDAALRSANLIGDGLYGVDLKEINGTVYVIEINDNPSIDAGVEDEILADKLYESIMDVFLRRIERSKERSP